MKKYIIIAGVNGAGKSTLYETLQFFVMVRWLDYRRPCLNG